MPIETVRSLFATDWLALPVRRSITASVAGMRSLVSSTTDDCSCQTTPVPIGNSNWLMVCCESA